MVITIMVEPEPEPERVRVRERPLGRHRQGRVSQEEAGAKRMLRTMAGLMLQELKVCGSEGPSIITPLIAAALSARCLDSDRKATCLHV